MRRIGWFFPCLVLVLANAVPASAQGLIWTLPAEDGTWVRYEGDYQHVRLKKSATKQPTLDDANRVYQCDEVVDYADVMCWRREITIKSVGTETGTFRGEEVPCRWIEIKSVTGKATPTGIDPGPAGASLYKVLVPESAVVSQPVDERNIPVAFVPVVKGWRKSGTDPAEPIETGVLQAYPLLTLVAQYRTLEVTEEPENAGVPLDADLTATRMTGQLVVESLTDRSTNTATLWRSDQVPFGLAKWEVVVVRETKNGTVARDRFEPAARISVQMTARETGTDAVGELTPPEP